jgi:hypothetical protein
VGRFSLRCRHLVVGSGFSQPTSCAIIDIKSYQIFLHHSSNVIFWRDVQFDEISLACVTTSSSFPLFSSSTKSPRLVSFLSDDSFF